MLRIEETSVPDLPFHPDTGDHNQPPTAGRRRWRSVLAIAIAVVLIAAFIALHVTGVLGPGDH
jgi:hypothetical protein